jgi:hypothetical protein
VQALRLDLFGNGSAGGCSALRALLFEWAWHV